MTPRLFSPSLDLKRFEAYLRTYTAEQREGAPAKLAQAIDHALFVGAGRLRPALGLAMGYALGIGKSSAVLALCAAVELVHSASLVHDDLPCFDDADLRRGQASVHRKYGQPLAILTGDALIAMAFGLLAHAEDPQVLAFVGPLARAIGPSKGIIGGQALECEPGPIDRDPYHDAKTGALFALLGQGMATLAKADPQKWAAWGAQIGRIYQRCDDLSDQAPSERTGKPCGQDQRHQRPAWAPDLKTGVQILQQDLDSWLAATPPCLTKVPLSTWTATFEKKLLHRLGLA